MRQLRWAVLLATLDPVEGHEQGGRRPALVVSQEPFHASGTIAVCPITAAYAEPKRPHEVPIPLSEAGQTKPGVVLCHQLRTIFILRIARGSRVGSVTDPDIRSRVRESLAVFLGLDVPGGRDGSRTDRHFQ